MNDSLTRTTVSIAMAEEIIKLAFSCGLVPFLKGSPGVGKSDLVRKIAREANCELIDIRLSTHEPSDLTGMPEMVKVPYSDLLRTRYAPMEDLPITDTPVPEGKNGWIINFDELPGAEPAMQKAAYKVLLDRQVGKHNLHPNVFMIVGGNLDTDNAQTNEIGTALMSRLSPHIELAVDAEHWLEWAYKQQVHHYITSFIEYMPNKCHDFDPDTTDNTFACPRTWDFASRMLNKLESKLKSGEIIDFDHWRPAIEGTIGHGMATEFIAFLSIYKELPKFSELMSDPATVDLPSSPNLVFALCGVLSDQMNKTNAKACFTVLNRFEPEFQICALRAIRNRKPKVLEYEEFAEWVAENSELFAA